MTQFTTTITQMYTLDTPEPGFVVNCLWQVTGVDGSNTASIDGNSQFTVQEGTFIPYDQLTQAQSLAGFPPSRSPAHRRACRVRLIP